MHRFLVVSRYALHVLQSFVLDKIDYILSMIWLNKDAHERGRLWKVRKQIEFYFSWSRFPLDNILNSGLDAEGFFPVQKILEFNKIKECNASEADVRGALRCSRDVLLSRDGSRLRPRFSEEVYTKGRVENSIVTIKYFCTDSSCNEGEIQDFLRWNGIYVMWVTIFRKADGTCSGRLKACARSPEEASRLEREYPALHKVYWPGQSQPLEILLMKTYKSQKKQKAPTESAAPSASIEVEQCIHENGIAGILSKFGKELAVRYAERYKEHFSRAKHWYRSSSVVPPFFVYIELVYMDEMNIRKLTSNSRWECRKRKDAFYYAILYMSDAINRMNDILDPYICEEEKASRTLQDLFHQVQVKRVMRVMGWNSSYIMESWDSIHKPYPITQKYCIVSSLRRKTVQAVENFRRVLQGCEELNRAVLEKEARSEVCLEQMVTNPLGESGMGAEGVQIEEVSTSEAISEMEKESMSAASGEVGESSGMAMGGVGEMGEADIAGMQLGEEMDRGGAVGSADMLILKVPVSKISMGILRSRDCMEVNWSTSCKVHLLYNVGNPQFDIEFWRHRVTYKFWHILSMLKKPMRLELEFGGEGGGDGYPAYARLVISVSYTPILYGIQANRLRWTRESDFTCGRLARCNLIVCEFDLSSFEREAVNDTMYILKNLVYLGFCDYDPGSRAALRREARREDEAKVALPNNLEELDYWIRWKLCCLVTNNVILLSQITEGVVEQLLGQEKRVSMQALQHLENLKKRIFEFEEVLGRVVREYAEKLKGLDNSCSVRFRDSTVPVGHIAVSPLNVRTEGPFVEISNRVQRQFPEIQPILFRVSFCDEHCDNQLKHVGISLSKQRVMQILENGIREPFLQILGIKCCDFFLYSSSQLRTQKAWFLGRLISPSEEQRKYTVEYIRSKLGDFSGIYNLAMYSSRLGQALSSTYSTLKIRPEWILRVEDVVRNGYVFSDGCGVISPEVARLIAKSLMLDHVPQVYQFRLGGIKGTVSTDTRLEGHVVKVRPSMIKFESAYHEFEVITWAKHLPAHLNRQIILLLSTLGVPDATFLELQNRAVKRLLFDQASDTESEAAKQRQIELLETTWRASNKPDSIPPKIIQLIKTGFSVKKEPYLASLMKAFTLRRQHDIRIMARIPVEDGLYAIGVMDEYDVLEPGMVFVRKSTAQGSVVLEGKVCVSRSPCLHPGDVAFLTAVKRPELMHLENCIVFPQRGDRCVADICSGGDLDGDTFLVLWGEVLEGARTDVPPDAHTSSSTASKLDKEDNEVLDGELNKFFVDFMHYDRLGQIADAHMYYADKSDENAFDKTCLMLAKMHNIAVDSPKTGLVVPNLDELNIPKRPDFLNTFSTQVYPSKKILGKLYRSISDQYLVAGKSEASKVPTCVDPDLVVEGHEQYIGWAMELRDAHNACIRDIMGLYQISDEGTMVTGDIIYETVRQRKEWQDKRDNFDEILTTIRREISKKFYESAGFSSKPDSWTPELLARASACYVITYSPEYDEKDNMLSFPWIWQDILCQIKTDSLKRRQGANSGANSASRESANANFAESRRVKGGARARDEEPKLGACTVAGELSNASLAHCCNEEREKLQRAKEIELADPGNARA